VLLDLFFLTLALMPLVPISRFRWRETPALRDLPVSLERCLYMDTDEGEEITGTECYGMEVKPQAPEALGLHPQHS
jgi:hypothetical protein